MAFFRGKKQEPEQNGHANGAAPNGGVKKRTADLAIYEQYEQQVRALCLCAGLFGDRLVHAGVLG